MIVHLVRFRSGLSDDEVRARVECRLEEYRKLPGLLQKYYLHFPDTGEWGGLYLWDSQESLEHFKRSPLGASIPAAYRTESPPHVEVAEAFVVLHPEAQPATQKAGFPVLGR